MMKQLLTLPFIMSWAWLGIATLLSFGTKDASFWAALIISNVWFGIDYLQAKQMMDSTEK